MFIKMFLCFSLVFAPSTQVFAQVAPLTKENARFPNPHAELNEDNLLDDLVEAAKVAADARKEYEIIEKTKDSTEQYQQAVADARTKLEMANAEKDAAEERYKHAKDPISCFDLFIERRAGVRTGQTCAAMALGPMVGLGVGGSMAEAGISGGVVPLAIFGGIVTGIGLAKVIGHHRFTSTINLASRLDLKSCGVDSNPSPKEQAALERAKLENTTKVLNFYNKRLSKRGKTSRKASIDDVREVMVEGFNSGAFCYAKAPKKDSVELMNPKQMNAYVLKKLEARLGGSKASAAGEASGQSSSSGSGRTQIAE
jgi:hypothetical protein